jgi:hypothetical protein
MRIVVDLAENDDVGFFERAPVVSKKLAGKSRP